MKRYIIVSEKTGKEHEVSEHELNWLKSNRKKNRFKIIEVIEPKKLPKPEEIVTVRTKKEKDE